MRAKTQSDPYREADRSTAGRLEVPSTKEGGPLLNEKEIQLCCLLKADFSTKEINMLTRQSLQTIYQRKTQIRQKLDLAEGDDIAAKLS